MTMESASTSEAALKLEIARLTGAINRHKSGTSTGFQTAYPRSNTYVNPNYKPAAQHVRSTAASSRPQPRPQPIRPIAPTSESKEVVIGGITFESSGRSLVRKDRESSLWDVKNMSRELVSPSAVTTSFPPVPKPVSTSANSSTSRPPPSRADFSRSRTGHLIPSGRPYKPKTASRGRGGLQLPHNMTLTNNRRPYQSRRLANKRKYSDKPCPRFTTTGACSRGLTCMYQHDASKVAICWNFLQGKCPNTADSCNLSHDPTPERTPLCVHFANNGRCNRENCPFPHIRVSARQGVCRDFAVLGYCAKGLDCDKQHVRECPDFAEKGSCSIKGCKLPHVIRANRTRKPTSMTVVTTTTATTGPANTAVQPPDGGNDASPVTDVNSSLQHVSAEDAQLGDEYISLTFHESESSEDDSDDEEEEDEDDTPNHDDE